MKKIICLLLSIRSIRVTISFDMIYIYVNIFRRLCHPREREGWWTLFPLSDYLSIVMYRPISPNEINFVRIIYGIRIYSRNGIKSLHYVVGCLNDPWVDLQRRIWLQDVGACFFLLVLVNQWPVTGRTKYIKAYVAKSMQYANNFW